MSPVPQRESRLRVVHAGAGALVGKNQQGVGTPGRSNHFGQRRAAVACAMCMRHGLRYPGCHSRAVRSAEAVSTLWRSLSLRTLRREAGGWPWRLAYRVSAPIPRRPLHTVHRPVVTLPHGARQPCPSQPVRLTEERKRRLALEFEDRQLERCRGAVRRADDQSCPIPASERESIDTAYSHVPSPR